MGKEKILLGIDGVDHVNIYSSGKTRLGRVMSNFFCWGCRYSRWYISIYRNILALVGN